MKHLILTLIAFSFFAAGCAKNRGVEPLRPNVTEKWENKADVRGTGDTADAYYAKWTVVKNSYGNDLTFVGMQGDMSVGFFEFTEDKLKFNSLQGRYKGRPTANLVPAVVYQWQVTHHEAQLQTSDGKTSNKEIDDDRLNWKEKKNFKIDFGMHDVLPVIEGPCWEKKSTSEVPNSREVKPGYMSFVVEVVYDKKCSSVADSINQAPTVSVQYRYSFVKKEESDYVPMVFKGENDSRMRKFGYFQSIKEETTEDDRPFNIFLVNRWNPNKTHNFYFTKEFPEQYKYIFYDIFQKTNDVFASKGLKIRFKINENTAGDGKVKEFGDLRYSFVNLIEEMDPTAPLGYGPSDANPFTGEIIAANLNVWTGLIKYYMTVLKTSSARNPYWFSNGQGDLANNFENSKWAQSELYTRMKVLLGKNPIELKNGWEERPELGNFFREMSKKTTYVHPLANMFTAGSVKDVLNTMTVGYKEVPMQLSEFPAGNGVVTQAAGSDVMSLWTKDLVVPSVDKGIPTIPSLLIRYEPLENNPLLQKIAHLGRVPDAAILKDFSAQVEKYKNDQVEHIHANQRGHCILDAQASLAGFEHVLIEGVSIEEAIAAIVYRTSIHEFGHNLNLRHNFYGSVDGANFLEPSVPMYAMEFNEKNEPTGKRIPVMENGVQKMWPAVSSSVMDYMRLQDEFYSTKEWEPYDKAALLYAYSDGKIDDKKLYLYCSDEHTFTSAFCNRFDKGTSPTEIAASFIESYEDSYYTNNHRLGRAYWNTSGYMSKIFSTMKELKEFLPMWRSAFYDTNMRDELEAKGLKKYEVQQNITEMNREIKESIRMIIAFYNAVLESSDKPYRSVYTDNGSLERLGVTSDKMVAMYFLAGDDPIYYNPNRVQLDASFLSYSYVPEFVTMMDKVNENIITQRLDMEPWFISIGRVMYAQSAKNYSNRYDESFINRIKVKKYRIDEITEYFGLQLKNEKDGQVFAEVVALTKSDDPDFRKGEEVAIVSYQKNVYVFSKQESTYAYSIYRKIVNTLNAKGQPTDYLLDLEELYLIYSMQTTLVGDT